MSLLLYLFGSPRIEHQGVPVEIDRRKALALAAYLAVSDQPMSRDIVAAMLWPDLDQQRARAALRSTLPTLTSQLPEGWIIADRMTLSLMRETVWVDVHEFLDLLAQTRSHGHMQDEPCNTCADLLEKAVALYRDDFLAGFTLSDSAEYDDWQTFQREWLRREFAGALKRLAYYHGTHGNFERAVDCAKRWLALDPLHEPAHRMLMRLYTASDQRSEAIRQYQECERLLDSELATPPEEETLQLYEEIKNNTVTPFAEPTARSQSAGVLPPLPSLMVGREGALEDLKARIGIPHRDETRPVTVIQGWPGVGKSTLVAALAHDSEVSATYPDGVLWASLGETPSLLSELSIWADALNLSDSTRTRQIDEITAQLTAVLRDKRMLLIVDDVWQVEHATPFRVGGQACAMMMTSRLNGVAQSLAPTPRDVYRLAVLGQDSALELLRTLTPETVDEHPNEARELVSDLEGLPLAIQVAGRLLNSEARLGWGVSDLLTELRAGAGLLGAQAPGDMAAQDTTPTVATLLQRSTDSLDEATRQRFALLGLFVPKPATFDLEAMAVAWEVEDPKPTARILVNRGLLEPVSGGRFQMHALLVLHARSLLGTP
jgi:DNA-binding SARP family transcriptional activator